MLLRAGCPDGAYYLAGYAAECALKACISKHTERFEFPDKQRALDSWTHDWDKLLKVAGLADERKILDKQQRELHVNWLAVQEWSEGSRYERRSQAQADALLNALDNRKYGVMRWLKRHW